MSSVPTSAAHGPAGRGEVRVTLFGSMEAAEPLWRELETTTPCTPFERYDWLRTWADHAGDKITPWPALLEWPDGSQLLLPLCTTKRSGIRVLSWLGDRVSDYNAPLASIGGPGASGVAGLDGGSSPTEGQLAPSAVARGWSRLLEALPPVDIVQLRGQPASIAGRPNPLGPLLGRRTATALAADLRPGWAAFSVSHLTRSRRRKSRRTRRRLAEQGELVFARIEDPVQIQQLVWASARMKRARYPNSAALTDDHVRFYAAAAARMAAVGGALVFALRCGQRLIAVEWGLQHQGRFIGFLDGFDPRWSAYSPGHLLMEEVAQWCSEAGLQTYDLSVGDEEFKHAWADERTAIYEYLEPRSARGRAYLLAQQAVTRAPLHRWLERAAGWRDRLTATRRRVR